MECFDKNFKWYQLPYSCTHVAICASKLNILKIGKKPHLNRRTRKQNSAYVKTKAQISCAVTVQLISAFVFATWILQYLIFLKPKLQASRIFSVTVQAGLCWAWLETEIVSFLLRRLIYVMHKHYYSGNLYYNLVICSLK